MDGEINNELTYRYIGIGKVNYGEGVLNVNGNALRGKSTGKLTPLDYILTADPTHFG